MVRNIWIFGDSFAHYLAGSSRYHNIISEHFNTTHRSYGLGGTAQEYTFHQVNKFISQFHKNDVIIIFLTDYSRLWLFEDNPSLATSVQLLEEFEKDKKLHSFLETYFVDMNYLQHVKKIEQKLFLDYLALATRKIKIRPIIIKNFNYVDYYIHPNLTYSIGDILIPSLEEFNKDIWLDPTFKEFRPNHLSERNHMVLAEKLIRHIEDGVEINLKTEFHKRIHEI